MGLFDSLQNGVSSVTGTTQKADPGAGFQLLNTNGGKAATTNTQITPFNQAYIDQAVQNTITRTQSAQQNVAVQSPTLQPGANPYGVIRQPWIFSTFADLTNQSTVQSLVAQNQGLPPNTIVWYANPKSVDWSISQRGMEAKTKSGTVLHIWRDRLRKTDYEDPKITLTFQSGSILPSYSNAQDSSQLAGAPNVPLSQGLNNFYQFLSLVDASKIKNGQANLVHILYRSRIFPSMVISGFFDPQSVVKFSDNSDNPFQINSWSTTFTIYRTVPAYNDWAKLAQQFRDEFQSGGDPFNRFSTGVATTTSTNSSSGFDPSKGIG